MVDPLSGLQTADAIVGLITAVIRVVKYCQKLKTASKLAEQVLERFFGLDSLLEAVRQICIEPPANTLPQLPTAIGHIKGVVDACERTVRRIEQKLGVYFDSSGSRVRAPGLADQRNLVGALPEIQGHLENLNAHKHTLGLWLNILTYHGQSRTQATNAYHALKAQIPDNVKIERALQGLLQQQRDQQRSRVPSLLDVEPNHGMPIGPAPSVRTSHSLGHPSSSQEDIDGEDESIYTSEALDGLIPVRATAQQLLALTPPLTERRVVQVPNGQNRHALDACINGYCEQGKHALHAEDFAHAENDYSCAIAYSEQRYERFAVPFVDRDNLLENLAKAYYGLGQWDIATRILEQEVLDLGSGSGHQEDDESVQDKRASARQLELLGSFYLRRWRQGSSDDDHWRSAHEHTQDAYTIWVGLEQDGICLTDDELKQLQSCLQQLLDIFKCKMNMSVEVDYYMALLSQRRPHAQSVSVPDNAHSSSSDSIRSREASIIRSYSINIPNVAALWKVVQASDAVMLRQFHEAAVDHWDELVNEQADHGETVLHSAVTANNLDQVVFLLSHGADINALDAQGQTPLLRAVRTKRVNILELMLQWDNKRVNIRTLHDGETVLHEAVKSRNNACIELLLEADPQLVDLTDYAGQTPLHYCAKKALVEQAELLIQKGADVDARDDNGRTPTRLALKDNPKHQAMYSLLCEYGAGTGVSPLTKKATNLHARYSESSSTGRSSGMSIQSDPPEMHNTMAQARHEMLLSGVQEPKASKFRGLKKTFSRQRS